MNTKQIRIGVSGWRYEPWRGVFYPKGLKQELELSFASHQLSTIELNGSFYALQRPTSYEAWYRATTQNFVFSVKGPRFITHILRLKNVESALANFLASGLFNLREKLGPILWQFPANYKFDPGRMAAFVSLLPNDPAAAKRLAGRHDERLVGRVALDASGVARVRHVVEVRNPSFATEEFLQMLRQSGVGLVVSDSDGGWPVFEDLTADLVYIRLHGSEALYASGYDDAALERWARRIECWSSGQEPADARRIGGASEARVRDVFCYFDNDLKVMAPRDARLLMQRLSLPMEPVLPDANRHETSGQVDLKS